MSCVPAKKSTLAIVPSLSLAAAVIVSDAGAVNDCPAIGLVIDTVGSWFGVVETVILAPADVRVAPSSSRATAVS